MKKFNLPLMEENITKSDLDSVTKFIKNKPILTQSKKVIEFEKRWSNWLGVKYSVFVNSGSSANFLTLRALKILKGSGEVILPPLTWISDVVAVIENGFKPIFVDINLNTLSMNNEKIISKINKNTKAIFITHAQGFNGLSEKLLQVIKKKKITLIEDVCESHGAKFKNKKLGTFGVASNFSFYYAHHMSTVEGGMICTNNKKIYELVRVLRAHGMAREMNNKKEENKIIKKYKMLSPKFIFLHSGFNMRGSEIPAVIGINQLKRLDQNIKKRVSNFKFFLKNLNSKLYYTNFDLSGNSNYAFPLILLKKSFKFRDKLETVLKKNNIEFRRGNAGGGNQLRQPYLNKKIKKFNKKNFQNVEHVHFFGYYIGNYPSLSKQKIKVLCKILNTIEI